MSQSSWLGYTLSSADSSRVVSILEEADRAKPSNCLLVLRHWALEGFSNSDDATCQDKYILEIHRVSPSAIHVNVFVSSEGAFCFDSHGRIRGIHSQGPWCFLTAPPLKDLVSNYKVNPIEQVEESE